MVIYHLITIISWIKLSGVIVQNTALSTNQTQQYPSSSASHIVTTLWKANAYVTHSSNIGTHYPHTYKLTNQYYVETHSANSSYTQPKLTIKSSMKMKKTQGRKSSSHLPPYQHVSSGKAFTVSRAICVAWLYCSEYTTTWTHLIYPSPSTRGFFWYLCHFL